MVGALKYKREIDPFGMTSVAQLLRWIKPGSAVLEMGPASGMMTKLLQREKQCDTVCIEIDPKAAQEAERYCRKMVVADLSGLDWEQKIEGESFDYITFADVLEHLADPLTVLRRALRFLKPEGEVLISVPNIGYVGVIAELLEGRFDYRRDGLLDETHLHFFTRKSLTELLGGVGLIGVEWSRTEVKPEFSEFRLQTKKLGATTRGVLSSVPDGDTYQFLVRCSKTRDFTYSSEEPLKYRHTTGLAAQIYFDIGNGFTESESIVIPLNNRAEAQRLNCEVPAGVKAIRLDPVDALVPVAISSISVANENGGLFSWCAANGQLSEVSGQLNLNEIHSSGVSVLIPSSDDPIITIIVECPEEATLSVELSLDGASLLDNLARDLKARFSAQDQTIKSLRSSLIDCELRIEQVHSALESYKLQLDASRSSLIDRELRLEQLQSDLESYKFQLRSSENSKRLAEETLTLLTRSVSWRWTRPFRVGKRVAKALPKYFLRRIKLCLNSRVKFAVVGSDTFIRSRLGGYLWQLLGLGTDYELRVIRLGPSSRELSKMREHSASLEGPCFSILMPTFRTNPRWLKEAIESVRGQVYGRWELCLADDASDDPAIRSLLSTYSANDKRIKVVFLDQNRHISGASNAALGLASGEFTVLLDHDDLLAPQALYSLANAISERPDVDVVYSDEDKISSDGVRFEPTCKPGWSPEYFLSFMYTGHISCFRTSLVRSVGGFREGLEGSQDYDLMLRVTEISDRVLHIPRVLYHWRVHQDSVAANLDSKPYAFVAAKKAILDALIRRGFSTASVSDSHSKGLYRSRRNASVEASVLFSIGELGAASEGFPGEVVRVKDCDMSAVRRAMEKLELNDSSVVGFISGGVLRGADREVLLDYFADQGVGIVAPLIVDEYGVVIAAGANYAAGKINPNFKGAQITEIGYRARLVVPFNVSFVYPQCFFLRAGLLRGILREINSLHELVVSIALEARRRSLRCVVDPTAKAIQGSSVPGLDIAADRLRELMAFYGLRDFADPFLPAGLPSYQGVEEMPIA